MDNKNTGLEIAVIGLSCRVPGARNYRNFWSNLNQGIDNFSELSIEEVLASGVKPELAMSSRYVRGDRRMEGKDCFDYKFFGYNVNEARLLSPQSRLLHEALWEATEDSGGSLDALRNTGLFIGIVNDYYWQLHLASSIDKSSIDSYSFSFLSEYHYIPSLLSYKFGFKGINMPIVTACSSSLVAVNSACKSLLMGECYTAAAGGVNTITSSLRGYLFEEGRIESRDGKCRPFDSEGSGTSWGEGVGFVLLKRLKDAVRDNDHIYAVIKGSAVNSDGNRRAGFTAPSVVGQSECIANALRLSQVGPESISYVETHGTGTSLGDPIEVEALNRAFNLPVKNSIPVGSVKGNVGHLNHAAGIIGFIKAVLCLEKGIIPASVNFDEPNPQINFDNGPFYVNRSQSSVQRRGGHPARISVTSLGISGINAHVILEESPKRFDTKISGENLEPQLLTLSAKSRSALTNTAKRVADFVDSENENLKDVAYTCRTSRSSLEYRKSFLFSSTTDLLEKLRGEIPVVLSESDRAKVFLFAGQGSQQVSMGKSLYKRSPSFRKNMDFAFGMLRGLSGIDYYSLVFEEAHQDWLSDVAFSQPVIFSFQYAFGQMLMDLGIVPEVLIGHSIGEYAAACLAGVFSLETGLSIVLKRAQLLHNVPNGRMVSVGISGEDLDVLLKENPEIFVAARNFPGNIVLSGLSHNIVVLIDLLRSRSIPFIEIDSQKPFHSRLLGAIEDDFRLFLEGLAYDSVKISFLSCLNGDFFKPGDHIEPEYWVQQMQHTVLFEKGVNKLLDSDRYYFIDIGPGNSNSRILRSINKEARVFPFHSKDDEYGSTLAQLGKMWELGVKVDWDAIIPVASKISLPTYAFDETKFLAEVNPIDVISKTEPKPYYTYCEKWVIHDVDSGVSNKSAHECILIFCLDILPSLNITDVDNHEKIYVLAAGNSRIENNNIFFINFNNESEFAHLFSGLKDRNFTPTDIRIVCSRNYSETDAELSFIYLYLSFIARSHSQFFSSGSARFSLVSDGIFSVFPQDTSCASKSVAAAALKVISKEFLNLTCSVIDVDDTSCPKIDQIVYRKPAGQEDIEFAVRNGRIYKKSMMELSVPFPNNLLFSSDKIYLVTGGYGGIGFEVCKYIAKVSKPGLVILGRGRDNVEKRAELETLGASVYYITCDLADTVDLSSQINDFQRQTGKINGVVHAAGVADHGGIILRRDFQFDSQVLNPKIAGTIALNKLLAKNNLDFFVGFSSRLVSNPHVGQLAYIVANSFLDRYLALTGGTSIQLPAISEVGMAFDTIRNASESEKVQFENLSILSKDVVEVMVKAIHSTENLLIVSRYSFETSGQKKFDLNGFLKSEELASRESLVGSRQMKEASSAVEIGICEILADVLCVDRVGVGDNFFELGGDSLKAMIVVNRIGARFSVEYPLRDLMEADTVGVIANYIEGKLLNRATITI